MTDLPYTDADLRAEAARQHHELTTDPDYMGVGEMMEGEPIASRDDTQWDELSESEFDKAQRAIDDLLSSAANTSTWAITLGAEGLTPDRQIVYRDEHGRATAAVHFAFDPDVVDVEKARKSLREAVRHGLGYKEA